MLTSRADLCSPLSTTREAKLGGYGRSRIEGMQISFFTSVPEHYHTLGRLNLGFSPSNVHLPSPNTLEELGWHPRSWFTYRSAKERDCASPMRWLSLAEGAGRSRDYHRSPTST